MDSVMQFHKRNVINGDKDGFKTLQRMYGLGPWPLLRVQGPVPTKYPVLPSVRNNALELTDLTDEEDDTNSDSRLQEEVPVPLRYKILPDTEKDAEESHQWLGPAKTKRCSSLGPSPDRCLPQRVFQAWKQKTPTGVDAVPQVQVPGSQVTVNSSNQELLPMTTSIPPDIRQEVEEINCQRDQRESSEVDVPLIPTEERVTSVPINLDQGTIWTRLILPISPAVALKYFQKHLTNLERKEILDFPEIFYLGLGAEKKDSQDTPEHKDSNFNADPEEECGVYSLVLHDHIAYRYEILENLGQGSFGLVLKCMDHKTKELVALKVIHDTESANCMALKELEILDVVRREDEENQYNVIHMKEHMTFRKQLCIVFELQGTDLYELMKENNFKGFTLSQTRQYAAALVTCLQMLHRMRIIHCDLKPENILLSEKRHGNIKVADFGCSFYEHQEGYTYVQTRFYRAPEVILGLPFGTAIDMWSLGCILAELYTGNPLFSGTNEADQLSCIMEVLGMPPDYIVQTSPRWRAFFDPKGQTTCLKKKLSSKDLASALRSRDPLFVDFVRRCLSWDSANRMTAEEAAQHQWLQKPTSASWWPETLSWMAPSLPSSPGLVVRDRTWTLSPKSGVGVRPLLSEPPAKGEGPRREGLLDHGGLQPQSSLLELYSKSFSPVHCCGIM